MSIDVQAAPDAPPIVAGTASRLKRSAAHPALAKRLRKMKGVVAMRSSVDPQSVTVRFERGLVRLTPGVASDVDVVITMDFNDADAKPKVKGAAKHPLLALAVAKVLEPPVGTWQEEGAAFWAFAADWPRMPRSLHVVCTDDGAEMHFGEPGAADFEVQGSDAMLKSVLAGDSILVEDMLAGKLMAVGTFEHASVLTGRSIAWVMGRGR